MLEREEAGRGGEAESSPEVGRGAGKQQAPDMATDHSWCLLSVASGSNDVNCTSIAKLYYF